MPERTLSERRELEQLSAYLDGMLSAREQAAVEKRLREDAAFRRKLDDLRLTVRALRSLPEVKLPRNFTLTPEMVGQTRRMPLLVMRAATAFAVLALVVTLGVDALTRFGLSGGMMAMEAAPQAAVEAVEAPVIAEEAPAMAEDALGGAAADSINGVPEEEILLEEAIEEEGMFAAEAEEPQTSEFDGQERSQAEEVPAEDAESEAGVAELPLATPAPTLVEDVVEAKDETPTPALLPASEPEQREARPVSILLLLELFFGGTAVVLAMLTLWMRRRG